MELRPCSTSTSPCSRWSTSASSPSGPPRRDFDGGTFEGRDGLRGTIAPGGVDWQLVRPDGVLEIDAHYLLLTDDGEPIEVRSTGLRKASAAVADRIAAWRAGRAVGVLLPHPLRLSTSAPRLAWMNDLLAVSTGERRRDTVRIDVHEVL